MKKQVKRQEETQIIFRNVPSERKVNPFKKYYAIIETEGTDKLYFFEGKFRSEATAYFEEEARLDHGKFKSMGVLK